jgi:crotonobetainyl-CoA:carnitine CoA-transferase CaiB-like acyl-CoA transferase
MKRPELLEDPNYATSFARSRNHEALDAVIGGWTAQHDVVQLEALLQEASVPATRIFTMKDIFADPHFAARDMLLNVPHDTLGEVTMAGVVPKLSRTPGRVRRSGGAVGRDTEAVLRELAGLSEAEIERLCHAGVLARPEAATAQPA